MNKGAHAVHDELRNELINYLRSQYLGKSKVLLDACGPLMHEQGNLYSEPYIESSSAYKTAEDGISQSKLPIYIRDFLMTLSRKGLGVYASPFSHQKAALEAAWLGKDVFVSTGTGSGKTECFMWPLVTKLVREAREQRTQWNDQRAARVIIMYPMNALVADQIGRLRRLLGDSDDEFLHAFREATGSNARRPQFGMYTGRTPYPGNCTTSANDKELAKSIRKHLINGENSEYYQQLLKSGKVPAKKNLGDFVSRLENGTSQHFTDPEDAELITRFEMQHTCPDILITNYSMMEYMLLRPREHRIWDDTKKWLADNPNEKLLFIIDEAHMYRGSAGGEVALLLRRLFHRLGISRERVQFILTTASMPHEADDLPAVIAFQNNLTAADESHRFVILWGETEEIVVTAGKDILAENIASVDLNALEQNETTRLNELKKWVGGVELRNPNWKSLAEAYQWLYDHLMDYRPFLQLFEQCRGKAIPLSALGLAIFPENTPELRKKAVDVLLAIAPMGKDEKTGCVLFPARMHMLFRGFRGVFVCSNPACPNAHTANGITIGQVLLVDSKLSCPSCQAMVYELFNDRRCGALYFRGYVNSTKGKQFLWTDPGAFFDQKQIKEIHLYVPMSGEVLPPRQKAKANSAKRCYLDMNSGYLVFNNDSPSGQPGYRELWYSDYSRAGFPDVITFSKCPKCRQRFSNARITSFSTHGNQAFFNLVRKQFLQQPPASAQKEADSRLPNDGRKVLLFSDSRQKAARLARDMSVASDEMAVRQLFMLALREMSKRDEQMDDEQSSLDNFYGYFIKAAFEQNIDLFSNESRAQFIEEKQQFKESDMMDLPFGKCCRQLEKRYRASHMPEEMQVHLLKMFCVRYNTLMDSGLCYLDPIDWKSSEAIKKLREQDIKLADHPLTDQEFKEVFSAILHTLLADEAALGNYIPDDRRQQIRKWNDGFGHKDFVTMPPHIAEVLGIQSDAHQQHIWMDTFRKFCKCGQADPNVFYLDMDCLHPVYGVEHLWYRCQRCGSVSPYRLQAHCPICGDKGIESISDFSAAEFWRENALAAVLGGTVRVIDTEEHTAQLGHKDQRSDMWAKTERYEMRFQDLVEGDEKPVDILSSTTTMEVGIDIGSLVAVGLRNMPPMRENYQQRAGRAGRRGAAMSTIVTFAEGGPHDAYYFKNPLPMFQGQPRAPWIDVNSERLRIRHLSLVLLNNYMIRMIGDSLDQMPIHEFLNNHADAFLRYLARYQLSKDEEAILLVDGGMETLTQCQHTLDKTVISLREKVDRHPDAYGVGLDRKKQKSMLDALYEEGVIPTYSFPKDVVSVYIENVRGEIEYQVERGLDMAISEYAPGRAIVVDKKTYQIGGLYRNSRGIKGANYFKPAQAYLDDKHFCRQLVHCEKCDWFGYEDDIREGKCPFCDSNHLIEMPVMVRPWGFSPKNGETVDLANLNEQYSSSEKPQYSTQPSNDMIDIVGSAHIRIAQRTNQQIIMINEGIKHDGEKQGFMLCTQCGAIAPGNKGDVLKGLKKPGNGQKYEHCKHTPINIILGHDFRTDMMVMEFCLPYDTIETKTDDAQLWLQRASTTLAEAFRRSASILLDIEFTDLQAGTRSRLGANALLLDIFLYDSLSSGAGYSSRVCENVDELLRKTRELLAECDCEKACNHCLKHYRNQYLQRDFDRLSGLELLEWGTNGKLPQIPTFEKKVAYLDKLKALLHENALDLQYTNSNQVFISKGLIKKECLVYPAMIHIDNTGLVDKIVVTSEALRDAKPFAVSRIIEGMQVRG